MAGASAADTAPAKVPPRPTRAGAAAAYLSTLRRDIPVGTAIATEYDNSINFLINATVHICIKIHTRVRAAAKNENRR